MKAKIRTRYIDLEGCAPDEATLARTAWHVWRLSGFYLDALRATSTPTKDHEPYVPPEVAGEHTERLAAMDAKLEAVLGDAVDEDEEDFEFAPDAHELVMMVRYGAIIDQYAWFIEELGYIEFLGEEDGRHACAQNIVMENYGGFDALLKLLLRASMAGMTAR